MNRFDQHADFARSRPLWLRITAGLCLFLAMWMGVAQSVHTHGDWLLDGTHRLDQAATSSAHDADCPLCVAAHSTLPSRGFTAAMVLRVVRTAVPPTLAAAGTFQHYELFGRPPPTLI